MIVADLHIHYRYSMATSKKMDPEHLDYWSRLKGINLVGTGDCTHPGWLKELEEKLTPLASKRASAGESGADGVFALRDDYRLPLPELPSTPTPPRFMLTGEISCIYKRDGRVRKIHNLVFLPGFQEARRFQRKLARWGSIESDGRPILKIDSRDLLEMLLETSSEGVLIPAHIWTPWFSVLGAKSGFDSLKECYGDLTPHVPAIETGLSSDPPMNWLVSSLDDFRIVSFSDAHSPEKLGREATLFGRGASEGEDGLFHSSSDKGRQGWFGYYHIVAALRGKGAFFGEGSLRIKGTVEFFPQEGKYHLDGHRKCGVCGDVQGTGICPICGKPLTRGVLGRVRELADRENPAEQPDTEKRSDRLPYYSLVSLKDLLSQIEGVGKNTKRVHQRYLALLKALGPELPLLLTAKIADIAAAREGGDALAEAIRRMRSGNLYIEPGYDGEYGRISVFAEGKKDRR